MYQGWVGYIQGFGSGYIHRVFRVVIGGLGSNTKVLFIMVRYMAKELSGFRM